MENTLRNSDAAATQTITFTTTPEQAAASKQPPELPNMQVRNRGHASEHVRTRVQAQVRDSGQTRDYGDDYGQMLLRDRELLFEKIAAEDGLDAQIRYFALYALMFSAVYGVFLGCHAGGLQILAGAFKIPLLLFGTLCLCLPALYMFNVLLGSKLSFRQTLVMLLIATYLMSALLAALAPILFFFIMTTSDRLFITLLAVITCSTGGGFAIDLLLKGMRYVTVKHGYPSSIRIVKIWALIYAIVGSQLSWGLRPLIGESGQFVFFRAVEGNFFFVVFKVIVNLLLQVFGNV